MEEKQIQKEKLVKVIEASSLNKGDVILVECQKGDENRYLKIVNEELKPLIIEKDLRVLAVTPDFDPFFLYKAIEVVKSFNENQNDA